MFIDSIWATAVVAESYDDADGFLPVVPEGEHYAAAFGAVGCRSGIGRFLVRHMANKFHEIAFTPSVKQVQEHYGTRRHYAKFESGPDRNVLLTDAESDFIEKRDGFYMATVGETGQPYIQFRGGPTGFLKVLDERTLGYADFRGNLQYISVGNLAANNKAALFLMDYPNQRRLKILATVEIHQAANRPDLIEKLADPTYKAKVERAVILKVEAFDWNCPQHITPRYTIEEVRQTIQPLNEHIEQLEKELKAIKSRSEQKK